MEREAYPPTRSWRKLCPECGTEMAGTGRVQEVRPAWWHVEFWCPEHREHFYIGTNEWADELNAALRDDPSPPTAGGLT